MRGLVEAHNGDFVQAIHYLTIIATGVLAAAPQFMPFIPEPYRTAATGLIASLGAFAHLFMESPSSAK